MVLGCKVVYSPTLYFHSALGCSLVGPWLCYTETLFKVEPGWDKATISKAKGCWLKTVRTRTSLARPNLSRTFMFSGSPVEGRHQHRVICKNIEAARGKGLTLTNYEISCWWKQLFNEFPFHFRVSWEKKRFGRLLHSRSTLATDLQLRNHS